MFNYENKTAKYVNKEMDVRLGSMTAQGLIKSEQEYKHTVKTMLSTIQKDFSRVTNPAKYVVRPDDVVSSTNLNNMFMDLEADVRVLFNELKDAHKILDMTKARNKIFFRRIKTKIASMWKEIGYIRESSFNVESADYTFFESFDSDDSSMKLAGTVIDKKKGVLTLKPAKIKTHNGSRDVAEVKVTMYPVENRDGGVYDTSSPTNNIVLNYKDKERDMMADGLWKTQLLTATIPTAELDLFERSSTSILHGVVVYLDIVFTGPKLINELGFDPYGEFKTKILGIRYKKELNDSWTTAVKSNDTGDNIPVSGEDVDWIHFRNITPFHARTLRIILHQENYNTLSKLLSKVDTMVDKVTKDLIEGRYKKSNYKYKMTDQMPRVSDTDKDRGTLYDEVMRAIEEEKDVNTLENTISEILVPSPLKIDQDISNWKVFNVGAWSIEPQTVSYSPSAVGTYVSHDPRDKNSGFRMIEGAPTEARIYTKQEEPEGSMIEWSLMAEGSSKPIEIPIIPNNDTYRTESLNIGTYYPLKNIDNRYNNGVRELEDIPMRNISKVAKLDFPMHPEYVSEAVIYEDGVSLVNQDASIANDRGFVIEPYNSTEIYIPGIDFKPGHAYSIKYVPALLDTVECFTIMSENEPAVGKLDVATGMVFANEGVAKFYAKTLPTLNPARKPPSWVTFAGSYRVSRHLCTKQEYDEWFLGGRVPVFVDESIDNNNNPGIQWLPFTHGKVYYSTFTKVTWLYDDSFVGKPFSDSGADTSTWFEIASAPPLINIKEKHFNMRSK